MILDSYPQSQNHHQKHPQIFIKSHSPKRIPKTQQQPEGQPRKHKPLTRLDGPPAEERKLRRNRWNGGWMRKWVEKYARKNRMMFLFGQ